MLPTFGIDYVWFGWETRCGLSTKWIYIWNRKKTNGQMKNDFLIWLKLHYCPSVREENFVSGRINCQTIILVQKQNCFFPSIIIGFSLVKINFLSKTNSYLKRNYWKFSGITPSIFIGPRTEIYLFTLIKESNNGN